MAGAAGDVQQRPVDVQLAQDSVRSLPLMSSPYAVPSAHAYDATCAASMHGASPERRYSMIVHDAYDASRPVFCASTEIKALAGAHTLLLLTQPTLSSLTTDADASTRAGCNLSRPLSPARNSHLRWARRLVGCVQVPPERVEVAPGSPLGRGQGGGGGAVQGSAGGVRGLAGSLPVRRSLRRSLVDRG
jgi:hypothetical protein